MKAGKPSRREIKVSAVEKYTPERKAEFLLSTATTAEDCRRARQAVKKLGIDPDSVRHRRAA